MIAMTMILLLTGCLSTSNEEEAVTVSVLSKGSISTSQGFGHINTDFFAEYEDKATLHTLENIISSAVQEPGIVDMAEPQFDLELTYSDGSVQGYHLWVGSTGQRSTLMKVTDTHTVYSVSKEMTETLRELVQ